MEFESRQLDLIDTFVSVYVGVTNSVACHKWKVAHDLVREYETRWRTIGKPARMDTAAYVKRQSCGLSVRAACLFTQRDGDDDALLELSGSDWIVRGWASHKKPTTGLGGDPPAIWRVADVPTQRGLYVKHVHNCHFIKGSKIAERNLTLLKMFASELAA